jgi:hypothetical protein
MQEVEASTLETGIIQGIDDSSSSKESFVLVSLLKLRFELITLLAKQIEFT